MPDKPFVSIIIVNYNGRHYLEACLDALQQQTYPRECFEVIVSDNGSTDGSLSLLRDQYPWVRVLDNGKNLGFATGNNVAIQQSKGQYVLLLNNDTAPDPAWLEEMVNVAKADPKAGIVTGHLHLFYDQLELNLQVDTAGSTTEMTPALRVYQVETGAQRSVVQYLEGFIGWQPDTAGRLFRYCEVKALLGIPLPFGFGEVTLQMKLAAPHPVRVRLLAGEQVFADWFVTGQEPVEYSVSLPASLRSLAAPLEQNTGSIVFFSGAGRDRGTYVKHNEVFFEKDQGQYGQVEEVFAGCGASLLLKREMLEDVGLLDDHLFMYYEDMDLAWRARIRGWKVIFAPRATIRHIHCGTTKEWSPFFLYLIERNRLAMVFKNGSFRQVLRVWGGYGLKNARLAWKTLKKTLRRRPEWRQLASELRVQLRVAGSLLLWQPRLWASRTHIQMRRTVSAQAIESWFVGEE